MEEGIEDGRQGSERQARRKGERNGCSNDHVHPSTKLQVYAAGSPKVFICTI
jgi:hypothetical protein